MEIYKLQNNEINFVENHLNSLLGCFIAKYNCF